MSASRGDAMPCLSRHRRRHASESFGYRLKGWGLQGHQAGCLPCPLLSDFGLPTVSVSARRERTLSPVFDLSLIIWVPTLLEGGVGGCQGPPE